MWREIRDWLEELACRAGLDSLPSVSRLLVAAVAVVGVCVGATFLAGSGQAAAPSSSVTPETETTASVAAEPSAPPTITVHVVGEVRRPGVYSLPAGARAIDAIEAAGGMLGDADQAAINLAREVSDGEQLVVVRQGEASPAGGAAGTSGTGSAGGKVDLNSATAEQLDALPGVGPATAQKIVTDREANGPFRTVDDLMRVSGIGPTRFEALKDLITVR